VVLPRRLQILPDSQKIDIRGTQIIHNLQHLGLLLAKADHDPRFCEQGGIKPLGPIEQPQRIEIARARPHLGIETGYGFEIVIEDVRLGGDDGFERRLFAQKIGCQDLDRRARSGGTDRPDGLREVPGAAVIQIVAVDRGHDDMREPQRSDRLGDALRLVRIE
jgi:hypothetical protein